jgi:hypothetical protein
MVYLVPYIPCVCVLHFVTYRYYWFSLCHSRLHSGVIKRLCSIVSVVGLLNRVVWNIPGWNSRMSCDRPENVTYEPQYRSKVVNKSTAMLVLCLITWVDC